MTPCCQLTNRKQHPAFVPSKPKVYSTPKLTKMAATDIFAYPTLARAMENGTTHVKLVDSMCAAELSAVAQAR